MSSEISLKKKIIFVDDEPHILNGLRRMLRPQRSVWDCEFSDGGAAALEKLALTTFDVIVSDMRMPGMDGAELLEKVSQLSPSTVRIVLSGQASPDAMRKVIGHAHQCLAKPCESEELVATLKKACLISDLLNNDGLRDLLECLTTLPSVPDVYRELIAAINNDDCDIEHIGKIISKDPAMSGKMLQVVNSAFFGLPRSIGNPEQAVVILGLNIVKDLVLGLGIFNQISEKLCDEFQLDKQWLHCKRVSAIARVIAIEEGMDRKSIEMICSAGLFHDFGRFVVASCLPDMYRDILLVKNNESISMSEAEEKLLGATHAEVGAYVLGVWGLPEEVMSAVACHHKLHQNFPESQPCAAIIHAADIFDAEKHDCIDSNDFNEELLNSAGFPDRIDKWRELISEVINLSY